MKIVRNSTAGRPSEQRSDTFTGTVWADPVMPTTDDTTINNVFFSPGARTHWHTHERGQVLHVVAGSGLICSAGGTPEQIGVGDTIWIPAGERHWHGANEDSYLLHTAVSLGTTAWADAVSDSEYGAERGDR
ncbi:MAG: cupin domain-containing protein [Streptosporangiales bacterium]|nr:cupin domain-containing protein [Streptosporangiales bacterium]